METVPSPRGKPAPKPAESKPEYKMVLKVCGCECEGCKKRVKEILTKIEGVRTVGIDFMQQEVKVVVVGNVDSKTLINKLKKKTGKQAELWLQEDDQNQNKQENGKSEPKSSGEEEKEEWVLKVPLHCEIGCQNDVEKALKKIEGVHTVHIDKQGKVTVVGNVDLETLKEELKNKLRKHSELWPQEGDQKQKELKGNSTNNAVEVQGRGSQSNKLCHVCKRVHQILGILLLASRVLLLASQVLLQPILGILLLLASRVLLRPILGILLLLVSRVLLGPHLMFHLLKRLASLLS